MSDRMDMERHDFELDDLVEKIRANDNRLVALQVPEGLKMQALEMMDSIEDESDAKVILAADPCYGACDLVHDKMRMMGVELVAQHTGYQSDYADQRPRQRQLTHDAQKSCGAGVNMWPFSQQQGVEGVGRQAMSGQDGLPRR